jgi:hypothetical protein
MTEIVTTKDHRVWHVFVIGSAAKPPEWIVVAKCDQDPGYRSFHSDKSLAEIPKDELAQMIETADALAHDTLDQWATRPRTQSIQPPARRFLPGQDALTGIGIVVVGVRAMLRTKATGQRVFVRVTEMWSRDLFSGVVEEVATGPQPPDSIIGRTVGFFEDQVFSVS